MNRRTLIAGLTLALMLVVLVTLAHADTVYGPPCPPWWERALWSIQAAMSDDSGYTGPLLDLLWWIRR